VKCSATSHGYSGLRSVQQTGLGQTEREFIDENMVGGTAADEEADRQLGVISSLQESIGELLGAGITNSSKLLLNFA
jgi:hypothetical protein